MTLFRMARGEQRRRSRKVEVGNIKATRLCRTGDAVRWRNHSGTFRRDVGNGQCEVEFDGRIWRVPVDELG